MDFNEFRMDDENGIELDVKNQIEEQLELVNGEIILLCLFWG